jgi:ADP-heptose:LPS heptosyltransferase
MRTSRDLFFYYHGLGDSILFNSVVHELGRKTGKKYFVGTHHGDIYAGNPYAVVLPFSQDTNYKLSKLLRFVPGSRIHHIDYYFEGHPPKRHILKLLCERVGLHPPIETPSIFLSPEELKSHPLPNTGKPWVAIQSTGLTQWTDNKNWGVAKFEEVARMLRGFASTVQLGVATDPGLEVDYSLQGRLQPREVCAILKQCGAFVGQVGFLMHAAAAAGVPGVIVYGGFEAPWQSGYRHNTNLYSTVECAPCWLEKKCPYNKTCMEEITPAMVAESALSLIRKLS